MRANRKSNAVLGAVFLAWAVFVLISFYVVQKPIMPPLPGESPELDEIASAFSRAFSQTPNVGGFVNAFADLLVAGTVTLAALSAGDRILRRWSPPPAATGEEWLEHWLLSGGLGLGAIGIAAFLLGLFGMANAPALGMICVMAPLALGRRALVALARDVSRIRLRTSPAPTLFVSGTLLLALLSALAPPTAYDAWLYHLALPRRALEMGRITPLFEILPHEGFPALVPSLFMIAMSLRGDVAAQLLHYVFGLLTLAAIGLATRRWYSTSAASTSGAAPLLALSMPMFALLGSWAYSDLALAFYHVAAVFAYRRHLESGSERYLRIAGALAGLAVGVKYTAFVLPAGIVLHMLWKLRRRAAHPIAVFAIMAAALALPWFLRNWSFYGNPVYPFAFGGIGWDNLRAAWYAQVGTGIGLDPFGLLSLPIVAMQGYRDANFWDGRIGPVVVVLLPLLFLRTAVSNGTKPHAAASDPFLFVGGLGVLFWVVGVITSSALWQTRLLLPSLLLLTPALAAAAGKLRAFDLPSISFHRVFWVLAGIALALGLFRQGVEFAKLNPLGILAGTESRDAFQERRWQEHVRAMRALNALPDGTRVQFLWEPRTYLARRKVRADVLLDALHHQVALAGSLESAVSAWKSEGITHLLIFDAGAQFALREGYNAYTPADVVNLRRLREDFLRPVYENSAYSLWELK